MMGVVYTLSFFRLSVNLMLSIFQKHGELFKGSLFIRGERAFLGLALQTSNLVLHAFLDIKQSMVAKKMGIEMNGEYSLKVR